MGKMTRSFDGGFFDGYSIKEGSLRLPYVHLRYENWNGQSMNNIWLNAARSRFETLISEDYTAKIKNSVHFDNDFASYIDAMYKENIDNFYEDIFLELKNNIQQAIDKSGYSDIVTITGKARNMANDLKNSILDANGMKAYLSLVIDALELYKNNSEAIDIAVALKTFTREHQFRSKNLASKLNSLKGSINADSNFQSLLSNLLILNEEYSKAKSSNFKKNLISPQTLHSRTSNIFNDTLGESLLSGALNNELVYISDNIIQAGTSVLGSAQVLKNNEIDKVTSKTDVGGNIIKKIIVDDHSFEYSIDLGISNKITNLNSKGTYNAVGLQSSSNWTDLRKILEEIWKTSFSLKAYAYTGIVDSSASEERKYMNYYILSHKAIEFLTSRGLSDFSQFFILNGTVISSYDILKLMKDDLDFVKINYFGNKKSNEKVELGRAKASMTKARKNDGFQLNWHSAFIRNKRINDALMSSNIGYKATMDHAKLMKVAMGSLTN